MFKKIIIVIAVLFVLIIGALIAVPFLFKDRLLAIAKEEINKQINAKVDFEDFGLSIFRDFPNLTVSLDEVTVINIAPFEGDTLAAIGSFNVSLDIMTVIRGETVDIKAINLNDPHIHVMVLKDGTANYDIAKPSETEKETTSSDISFKLQEYSLSNGHVVYDDKSSELYAEINNLNHSGRGDFTLEVFDLETTTTAEDVTVGTGGIKYLNEADLALKIDLGIDLPNNSYTFKENTIQINNLLLGLDGNVVLKDEATNVDITFAAKETSFKNILSLVPAIYLKDFEDVQTEGQLALSGFAKGTYAGESYPAFGLDLKVENAMFKYPDLPTSVSDINIMMNVDNPGGDLDNTVVDVPKFNIKLGNEPFRMKLNVKYPISDPLIDAEMVGKINLANVTQYYPLEEGDELAGIVDADAAVKGRLSSIEKEQYGQIQASGNISIANLKYKSQNIPEGVAAENIDLVFASRRSDQPATGDSKYANIKGDARLEVKGLKYASNALPGPLTVSNLLLTLNSQQATLENFDARVGESDIRAKGQLENLMNYLLADGTIKGKLDLNSNYINLNQLMADENGSVEKEVSEEKDSEEVATEDEEIVVIPANIDFEVNTVIDKILYDEVELTNTTGKITVRDESLKLSYLKTNLLNGDAELNGTYSTKDPKNPTLDFGYDFNKIDIQEAFKKLNPVRQLAPIAKYMTGIFSSNMTMTSEMEKDMSLDIPSVLANGRLEVPRAKISNLKVLDILADRFKLSQFKEIDINNAWTVFEVIDGRIFVEPFDLNIKEINMNVSGSHGIDNTLDYNLILGIPRNLLGKANDYVNELLAKSPIPGLNANTLPDMMKFNVGITGTMSDPKITIGFSKKDAEASLLNRAKDELNQKRKELQAKAVQEAEAAARAQAQRLKEEAQKQADKIMAEARDLAERAKKEGSAQAQKLVDQAKNPIAKVAAEAAAKKLRQEADKRADQLIQEADKRAKKLVEDANRQGQKLIQDAVNKAETDIP